MNGYLTGFGDGFRRNFAHRRVETPVQMGEVQR